MKSPPVRDSSEQGAREARLVQIQQTSSQAASKTGFVSAQQTSGYPEVQSRPTELAWSTLAGELETTPFQHTMSRTKLPPIQQTSGLNQTVMTMRTALEQQITNQTNLPPIQSAESREGPMQIRRNGRQEACEPVGERRSRRQGVCKQTDDTQAERTFVRVLNKRF